MTTYITNQHGIRLYLEGSSDFTDLGHFTKGKGWFAGLVVGNDELSGVWFPTKDAAMTSIQAWRG